MSSPTLRFSFFALLTACVVNFVPTNAFAAPLSSSQQNRYWRDIVNAGVSLGTFTSQGAASYQDYGSYDFQKTFSTAFLLSNPKITEKWSILGGAFGYKNDNEVNSEIHFLNLGKDYGFREILRTIRRAMYVNLAVTTDMLELIELAGGREARQTVENMQNQWIKGGRLSKADQKWITESIDQVREAAIHHRFLKFTTAGTEKVADQTVVRLSATFDRSEFIHFLFHLFGRTDESCGGGEYVDGEMDEELAYYLDRFLSRMRFDTIEFLIGQKDHKYYGSDTTIHTLSVISALEAFDRYQDDPRLQTDLESSQSRRKLFDEILNTLRFDAVTEASERRFDHGKKPEVKKPENIMQLP